MYNNVIIVGNGESILHNKNGSIIDKFNTVIRLGRYELDGYEDYTGKKTDVVSTIYWKLDSDRLKNHKVFLSIPLNYTDDFKKSKEFIEHNYKDNIDNIMYVNTASDVEGINKMYTDIMSPLADMSNINFSLGFKTFYFVQKLFPNKKIYATGFDFFKTGWYWDSLHNRDDSNRHPYIWERLWYSRMKALGNIYEL